MRQPVDHILTPEAERHFFQEQLLQPLLKGECISVFWVPHGGIRTKMTFFVQNAAYLGLNQLKKYRLVYINPYEVTEDSAEGYFDLMNRELEPASQIVETNNNFQNLKENIIEYLEEDYQLIFVLAEFNKINYPRSFFNNLFSLYQLKNTRIHFIFNFTQSFFSQEEINRYDQLYLLINQNKIYSPILTEADSRVVFKRLVREYGYQLIPEVENLVIKIAGGHPSLMKSCLQAINKFLPTDEEKVFDFLYQREEITIKLRDIWRSLTGEEKYFLLNLVKKGLIDKVIPEYLLMSGIVKISGKKAEVFGRIFEVYIKNQTYEQKKLTYNEEEGQLLLDGQSVKEKICLNDYQLLATFLRRPNEVLSRDEIAQALWGKQFYEKYSDWAIDQAIFQLRKKLELMEVTPSSIQTIKRRGYRWVGN